MISTVVATATATATATAEPDEIRLTPNKVRVLVTEPHVAAHLSDVWQQMKMNFSVNARLNAKSTYTNSGTKPSDCKSPVNTASAQSRS